MQHTAVLVPAGDRELQAIPLKDRVNENISKYNKERQWVTIDTTAYLSFVERRRVSSSVVVNNDMKYLILLFLTFTLTGYSQQTNKWIHEIEHPKYSRYDLKDSAATEEYLPYDFSELLNPKSKILGFIGTEYKRIKIKFETVQKSSDSIYHLIGHSLVGTNRCDFKGQLRIKKIKEFKTLHLGVDDIYADSGIVEQGIVFAEYEINESKGQKYSGTFHGIMTLWFYLDNSGNIHYDNIESHSDNYMNNQYVGEWNQYGSDKSKVCNWGEYRIPLCGDLDIGAGEFSVNPKYIENGWKEK